MSLSASIPTAVSLSPAQARTPLDPRAPTALVALKIARTSRGPLWTWEVLRCPYCRQRHTHGGHHLDDPEMGDPRRWLGGRVAHCHPEGNRAEYRLVEADPDASVALLERYASSYTPGEST